MKAVLSSSHVLIVPSLSLSSHVFAFPVFASPVSDRGNIIRQTASFSVSLYLNISQDSKDFVNVFMNGDYGTGSHSDNTVSSPHGFVIHGIEVWKGNEKVMEVINVENWRVDNSQLLRWVVSLFNGTLLFRLRSLRFRIRSGSGNGSLSSELEARVCIHRRICLGQFARKQLR
ncbi:hypothetical protein Tco_0566222 [Tanacetum coccineum]